MSLRTCATIAIAAQAVSAFTPMNALPSMKLRGASVSAVSSLQMRNEDRRDGFGGGRDGVLQVIEKRAKNDWGEGYGGSKGKNYDGPASFEEYMKKRAQEAGGVVKDAAGNDITGIKPSYQVAEGTWGATEPVKDADPLDWIDKSVAGFQKQDTNWLKNNEMEEWRKQKEKEKAAKEAEIEAKMAMWLKQAEEKKRAVQ